MCVSLDVQSEHVAGTQYRVGSFLFIYMYPLTYTASMAGRLTSANTRAVARLVVDPNPLGIKEERGKLYYFITKQVIPKSIHFIQVYRYF